LDLETKPLRFLHLYCLDLETKPLRFLS
jgi:hypothetical protein